MGEIRFVPLSDYENDCRILEIKLGASLAEIRQAYRDQTKVWHPDRFSNDVRLKNKADEKLKQINLAYRRLCGFSPYEQPVLSPAIPGPSSDWIAVFALRGALRNSVTVISKRFSLLMRKAVDISNSVFQWCRRERRSLAIATSAFVLGFALAASLLPRESDGWAKITGPRQNMIGIRGIAEAAVMNPTPTDPTVLSQTALVTMSSSETRQPPRPPSLGRSSSPLIAHSSADVFPWRTNIVTTVFWVGEQQVSGKTSPQHESVWDKDWLKNYGGVDDPERAARRDYIPISFVPRQNPFYCALPYNDVEQGNFKPEAPNVIPWFKQVHHGPGRSVCKDRWVAIRKGDRICYAQWEDSGPFRTDHFQYVFQNERPTPNASHGAGLCVSPAVRDYLNLAPTDVADWRFVEIRGVPPGPWRHYGENNPFVNAPRQAEESLTEQKDTINPVAIEPAQNADSAGETVMLAPAETPTKDLAERKKTTNPAGMEPAQQAATPGESVISSSSARPTKELAAWKMPANQPATKPTAGHRASAESVISASAAKAVTTYAPRPDYPQQARSHRIAGSGVCVVSVDPANGSVTDASMAQSTGNPLLDKSVLRTLRTWKFKPGRLSKVSVPVEFTREENR